MSLEKESLSVMHLMTEERKFPPPKKISERAHLSSAKQYEEMYRRSLDDAEAFWLEQASTLSWFKEPP